MLTKNIRITYRIHRFLSTELKLHASDFFDFYPDDLWLDLKMKACLIMFVDFAYDMYEAFVI